MPEELKPLDVARRIAVDAVDEAFKSHVRSLFDVLALSSTQYELKAITEGEWMEAIGRFERGIAVGLDTRDTSLRAISRAFDRVGG